MISKPGYSIWLLMHRQLPITLREDQLKGVATASGSFRKVLSGTESHHQGHLWAIQLPAGGPQKATFGIGLQSESALRSPQAAAMT